MHGRHLPILPVVAVLLTACSGGDDASDTPSPPSDAPTATATTGGPATSAPSTIDPTASAASDTESALPEVPRQPLTGEVVDDVAAVTRRPALAVKIDNHPSARENQSGLGLADIVFEELVEGGLTRFAAVFHTNDAERVGPVRSGRSQDVDLLTSFGQPLFAWSGGNPGVTRLVAESSLTDLNWQNYPSSYARGDGFAPHNLYSDTATLYALAPAEHPGAPPQQYDYHAPGDEFRGDRAIDSVEVGMAAVAVGWDRDPSTRTFLRSQDGEIHRDALTGPISADNVVLMVVEYRPSQVDARSPEAQTIGEGPVYVLSDGQVAVGRWTRDSTDRPIEFRRVDGAPIPLRPGTTWIELVAAIGTDDPANPDAAIAFQPPLD